MQSNNSSFIAQVLALFQKDLLIERRNKYVLGGLFLFSSSTVMMIYFSLLYNGDSLQNLPASTWGILFWMVVLFSSVNAVSNSFFREKEENMMYFHFLFSPYVYITAKLIYNVLFTLLLSIAASIIFIVVIPTHIHSIFIFTEVMVLGSISYAVLFTTMSAIALKAKSNNTLVAVLGFPILIPLLIFITKITSAALGDITMQELVTKNLMLLIALDIVQIILAIVLFPYIWRE